MRSVPDDAIPDLAFSVNAPGESEDQGQTSPAGDQSITDSCGKEWWQEAIKVAEQVDNIQRALDLTKVVSLAFLTCFYFLNCEMSHVLYPPPTTAPITVSHSLCSV